MSNGLGGNQYRCQYIAVSKLSQLFHQVPACTISGSSKMNKTGSRKARIQYAEDSPMDPKSKTLLSELRETAQLQQV